MPPTSSTLETTTRVDISEEAASATTNLGADGFTMLSTPSLAKRTILQAIVHVEEGRPNTNVGEAWLQHLATEDRSTLKRLVLERTAVGLMQPM